MARYNRGQSIRIDMDFLPRLAKKMTDKSVKYDKLIELRTRKATQMVWQIAHQKRPIISEKQRGRIVENYRHGTLVIEGATRRVSDPNARAGVPVHTGALQASIIQKVSRTGKGFQGKVETSGIPYASYMEYGTSNLRPRPFMRPAVNLTKDAIKRVFGLSVGTNV